MAQLAVDFGANQAKKRKLVTLEVCTLGTLLRTPFLPADERPQ